MSKSLPVLPLNQSVVLPGMVVPVQLTPDIQAAVDAARAAADDTVLVVPRTDGQYASIGTVATLQQVGQLPDGQPAALLQGLGRATIGQGVPGAGAALWVEYEPYDEPDASERAQELATEYKRLTVSLLQKRGAWQVIDTVNRMNDPSELADSSGYVSWLSRGQKIELLETLPVEDRLTRLIEWVKAHLAESEISEKINDEVREGMDKRQKEFLLREQLKAIRKELGEDDADGADDYRTRVEAADLPERVRTAALREVDKLERSSESPEASYLRTWLDTVLEMPWNVRTDDTTDLGAARDVLEADHTGLDDVKDRIIEYLAVKLRRNARGLTAVGGRGSGAVLALVGPPGVGKTSLGESVARALGRKFVRVALGGVRDEAEIRGHRRTYVGALPGRIVRAISEAGSMNPVVLLDEIDKVGADYRGDPSAALLEVLDPAQNHTFRDHYLDLDLDLSDVLFLATANVADTIPGPLYDRMEVVTLDGYTEAEKVAIGRDHLLRRQLERTGLDDMDVNITDDAFSVIASEYTREAGVRQLERSIARILRKLAVELAGPHAGTEPQDRAEPVEGDESDSDRQPVAESGTEPERDAASGTGAGAGEPATVVDKDDLVRYLGRPKFTPESAERTAVPGVATGLAVTGAGGDVLFIEATSMEGEPGLTLTGQLGDVMKESAQIAVSYLRAHGHEHGIDAGVLSGRRLHLHVPAGAVPKDGPSAGVTMVTALASMASGRPVRSEVAMTGEVTLGGRVLPVGGIKQKLLAAHRAGITTAFIPARNEPDLDDLPKEILADLTVHPVADVADILAVALAEPGTGDSHGASSDGAVEAA